jgi:FSR family fosmidomycin resistance protein-like MFS transporter
MLRNRVFTAVVGGHFMVDLLNSLGAVLLAVLAVPLGLSNQQIGLALTIYTLLGALSQPLFGWWRQSLALPVRSAACWAWEVGLSSCRCSWS